MGLYGQFLTYSGAIGLIVGARADLAILTSERGRLPTVRSAFIKLSCLLTLGALVALLTLSALNYAEALTIPLVASIVLGGLLASRFTVDGAALMKSDNFKSLRRTAFLRSFAQSLLQCSIFMIGHYGLIIGRLAGDALGLFLRSKSLRSEVAPQREGRIWASLTKSEKAELRKNANAYKYSFPQSLINSLSQGLPLILLPFFLPLGWIGQYTLAFTIVVAPLGLIATPIRQLLIGKFADDRAVEGMELGLRRSMARRWSWLLLLGALAGVVVLHYVASPIVMLLFGPGWELAAQLVVVLWFWAGTGFIVTPALAFLLAHNGNRAHLLIEVVQFFGRLIALAIGVLHFSDTSVIVPFVAWSATANVLVAVWILRRR